MRQASVGYHCPDCVGEAAARSPHVTGRSLFARGPAIATFVLVGLNVAVYLVGSVIDRTPAAPGAGIGRFTYDWGLYPPFVAHGEWWRLITGGFLHAGLLHLGMNMFVLWTVGVILEPAIGAARYLVSYVVSLVGGALGVVLLFGPSQGMTVGASGAIFGLFGLLVVYQLTRGVNPLQSGLGAIVLLNLLFTFAIPGISIGGHIGGLVAGGLVGAILFWGRPLARQTLGEQVGRMAVAGLFGVLLFALALTQAQALPGL
jgi:membrane associated rhomboid family serine protease